MKRQATLGLAIVGVGAVAYALTRPASVRDPEPVRFAVAQPQLFAAGGALTDAWADIDGDGDPDRFVGFNGAPSRLYRNDGTAGFVDVASELGLVIERSVRTAAWGDFDADGDPDLLLGYAGDGPVTALFRNDGAGGFVDVADEVGLLLGKGVTRQASWIDYDADGDLDLFLALRDRENRLYRNDLSDGIATFTDVTETSGIGAPRRTVGAVWFDADQDGDLDVLAANMGGDANGLWLQDGGAFTDAAAGTVIEGGGRGLGDEAGGTVRPCVVDFDNDGRLDVFFANYGPNELARATATGWESVGAASGLAWDARYDSCAWGDFDHDGTSDLYVNGTVTGGVQYRDWLFRREGGAVFLDVTPPELLELNSDHGATWVDYDLDGDLDLALTGVADDGMHHLMQNLLRPEFARHSLKVRVLDENGRATRAGTEVRVYAAGSDRLMGTRLVDTGSGYDAQSDLPVHFGLPGAQPVDVVITVVGAGVRTHAVLEAVDPSEYRGRVLTVRIAFDGSMRGS
jgi:hypothetical protein